jgi:hypothetical protein
MHNLKREKGKERKHTKGYSTIANSMVNSEISQKLGKGEVGGF